MLRTSALYAATSDRQLSSRPCRSSLSCWVLWLAASTWIFCWSETTVAWSPSSFVFCATWLRPESCCRVTEASPRGPEVAVHSQIPTAISAASTNRQMNSTGVVSAIPRPAER